MLAPLLNKHGQSGYVQISRLSAVLCIMLHGGGENLENYGPISDKSKQRLYLIDGKGDKLASLLLLGFVGVAVVVFVMLELH